MAELTLGELIVLITEGRIEHMENAYEGTLCGRPVVVTRSNNAKRIDREIELAQRTDVFGGVAKLLYHCGDGNWHYFAYERFDMSVAEFTSRVRNAVHIPNVAEQIANIYKYMHSQDIILRVHNSGNFNVVFTNREKSEVAVKFYGLGCSREVEGDLLPEISSTTCGNQHKRGNNRWTPPETTMESKAFGKKSDVYVLGNIFHQIGSGTFVTPDRKNISAENFWYLTPGLKRNEMSTLVHSMLETDGKRRITASTVLEHPFFWSSEKRDRFYTQLNIAITKHIQDNVVKQKIGDAMNEHVFMRHALQIPSTREEPSWDIRLTLQQRTLFRASYLRNQLSQLIRAIRDKSLHYGPKEALYFGEDKFDCMLTICTLYPIMTTELWTLCRNLNDDMDAMKEFC